jgi:regulator of replication initiation timing
MFGNKAPVVLYHRERVQELNGARVKAIEDFRKIGGEREKQFRDQQVKSMESIGKLWQQVNAEATEKYPQWFKPTEGADEENQILEEGFKLADAGFSDDPNMSPEQRVRLHSAIRNRAAGFGRMVYQNRKLATENAELREKLKQFEQSEPGKDDGKGSQKTEQMDTMDGVVAGLDAIAR